jgi:hypothetical protein
MLISQQFAGNFIKAADLPQPKVFTIQAVVEAAMPDGTKKPTVQFAGEQQQLVLNKTNAVTISQWYGDDTNGWPGKQIELFATQTNFGGKLVPCVRVRQPQSQQPAQTTPPVQQQAPAPQQPPVQQQIQAPPADYPIDA